MAKKVFNEIKPFWTSKTLWVGALQVISGICLAFSDHLATGGVLTASGVATIILRVVPKTQLK